MSRVVFSYVGPAGKFSQFGGRAQQALNTKSTKIIISQEGCKLKADLTRLRGEAKVC